MKAMLMLVLVVAVSGLPGCASSLTRTQQGMSAIAVGAVMIGAAIHGGRKNQKNLAAESTPPQAPE